VGGGAGDMYSKSVRKKQEQISSVLSLQTSHLIVKRNGLQCV